MESPAFGRPLLLWMVRFLLHRSWIDLTVLRRVWKAQLQHATESMLLSGAQTCANLAREEGATSGVEALLSLV